MATMNSSAPSRLAQDDGEMEPTNVSGKTASWASDDSIAGWEESALLYRKLGAMSTVDYSHEDDDESLYTLRPRRRRWITFCKASGATLL